MKNGVGTSVCGPGRYGSWINYYNTHAGAVKTCSVSGCTKTKLVGAHVITKDTGDQYCIITICHQHNHPSRAGWMRINKGREVVTVTEDVANDIACRRQ